MPENKDIPIGDVTCERRGETRLYTNAHVEIAGVDIAGNSFNELTKVKNFSDVGCQFQTQIPLRCGTVVAIKPLSPNRQRTPEEPLKLFEIMWTARSVPGWIAGVRALQAEKTSDTDQPRRAPEREA